ncbi:MAG: rhomboid family intramembrane serine protease [Actinomycetota bacterium]|nr:rhomboid family intramembrane serine protease [Actinomycetota bacterium]MDQ3679125.1 rhomboid family intramembrane serine protease [Actinomycetota bacterium]
MIPLKDYNPTRTTPVITIVLIAACVIIFAFVQPRGRDIDEIAFSYETAAIPCEVVEARPLTRAEINETLEGETEACASDSRSRESRALFPDKSVYLAVLYSMFLHGSWLHLLGNMLFLWTFGNNLEDRGRPTYLLFYLLAGLVATAAHVAVQPNSTVPLVGASGAIAGIMGAYLVLFPNVLIRSLVFLLFFVTFVDVRAKWLLGAWFVLQFFTNPAEGVAWVAHVGGFVFGVVAGLIWKALSPPERRAVHPAF